MLRGPLGLIVWLAICFGAAALGSWLTGLSVDAGWYAQLTKPPLTPPQPVFGIVWPILYAMMAVSAWLAYRAADFRTAPLAWTLFFTQLALNVAWSGLFFGLRSPGLALVDIALLLPAIVATAWAFGRRSRPAGLLLVPYALWVGFASYLNAGFWWLNA